jgi:hypothetical protein
VFYPLQDIAAIVEAMLWERAGGTEEGWHGVMKEVDTKDFLARSWPTALCSTEESALAAVRLTPAALLGRYKRYLKGKSVSSARAKAERVLARTQVYMPPEDMSLWTYFRTSENTVINKGSLGLKQASFDKARDLREQLKALQLQVAAPGAASAPSEPEPPTFRSCCLDGDTGRAGRAGRPQIQSSSRAFESDADRWHGRGATA